VTVFWIIAFLLATGALLFVLPPLLRKRGGRTGVSRGALNISVYRDQLRELESDLAAGTVSRERYDEARSDIERRLIEESVDTHDEALAGAAPGSRRAAVAVGLVMPLLAAGLYIIVGNPDGLSPERRASDKHAVTAEQIAAMVDKLAARLKEKPEDGEGWRMLGRSYAVLGRFTEAVSAYENAAKRMPGNAQILADQADALAMAQGGKLQGEPEILIERALKIDPENIKALALGGTVSFDKKDYLGAVALWERILKVAPADSEFVRSVNASIAEARGLAKESGAAMQPAAALPGDTTAAQVSGVAQLAPALAARVAPGDTVFIFARAVEGPRIPLAILRKRASDLPVMFVLDDSLAMSPAAKLSGVAQVIVGARISKSGDAMPKSGDFEGYSAPLKVGASGVTITIDTIVK
jgi:cytochrome c-type biogenesis protein CcmH